MHAIRSSHSLNEVRFRSCPNCGSFQITKGLLCLPCMDLAQSSWIRKGELFLADHSVIPLFSWPPGKSDTLSWLIRELKTAPQSAWSYYAKLFCAQLSPEVCQEPTILISHRSHSGHKHAFRWAEGLAEVLTLSHIEALELRGPSRIQQKNLTAQDRQTRVMGKLVDFSYDPKMKIVFVDDVVTTGSTAKAAYKALGRPKNFQVWSLAVRPLSSVATSQRP